MNFGTTHIFTKNFEFRAKVVKYFHEKSSILNFGFGAQKRELWKLAGKSNLCIIRNRFNFDDNLNDFSLQDALLAWLAKQVETYEKVIISDMTTSFQNGLALCAIIHRYRPDLIDFHTLESKDSIGNLQLAFEILDHDLGISPVISAGELADVTKIPDKLTMMSYLSQIYECFKREIPASTTVQMETIPEDEKISLGQIVAKKAAKKRKNNWR